jgi:hypothetical protein
VKSILCEEHGVDNIWVQPLDGSKGRRITDFTSQQIQAFHCKSLALTAYRCIAARDGP